MPQVAVIINGKTYRMACDEGQEQHLLDLSKRFDSYVSHLKESFGEIGDQRLTVMAGIMITDELVELQKKFKLIEAELASSQKTDNDALEHNSSRENELAVSLNKAAERISQFTNKLTKTENSPID